MSPPDYGLTLWTLLDTQRPSATSTPLDQYDWLLRCSRLMTQYARHLRRLHHLYPVEPKPTSEDASEKEVVFPNGLYVGQAPSAVPDTDLPYLEWFLLNGTSTHHFKLLVYEELKCRLRQPPVE